MLIVKFAYCISLVNVVLDDMTTVPSLPSPTSIGSNTENAAEGITDVSKSPFASNTGSLFASEAVVDHFLTNAVVMVSSAPDDPISVLAATSAPVGVWYFPAAPVLPFHVAPVAKVAQAPPMYW